jgi:hypothetical protein
MAYDIVTVLYGIAAIILATASLLRASRAFKKTAFPK